MSDYGDANLPDPPAYDPRVERADAEEELIAYRTQRLLDIALDEDNLFVCGALVRLIASSKDGLELLQTCSERLAIQMSLQSVRPLLPCEIRDALGLDD